MVKNQTAPLPLQIEIDQSPADQLLQPFIPNENDIIDDILRRVIAMAPAFSAALAAQIDKEARQQWGGDRPYISLRRGAGTSSRNAAIKRDHRAGEHIPLLERRYGLGKSRLWEIIKS